MAEVPDTGGVQRLRRRDGVRVVRVRRVRPARAVSVAAVGLVLALVVAACGGGGTISLPTVSLPTLPSVTLPTLPSVTLPTLPSRTSVPTETQTLTRTATVTSTPTPSATTPPPVAAPQAEGTSTPWWVWLLLAVLLVAVVASAVVLGRRRRALAEWDARLAAVQQDVDWVESSLVPQVLAQPTLAEAAATWDAARPRVLAIDEELHAVGTDAPDEERLAKVSTLQQRYAALVAAMNADTAASGVADVDALRASRITVDRARARLREALDPPSETAR